MTEHGNPPSNHMCQNQCTQCQRHQCQCRANCPKRDLLCAHAASGSRRCCWTTNEWGRDSGTEQLKTVAASSLPAAAFFRHNFCRRNQMVIAGEFLLLLLLFEGNNRAQHACQLFYNAKKKIIAAWHFFECGTYKAGKREQTVEHFKSGCMRAVHPFHL